MGPIIFWLQNFGLMRNLVIFISMGPLRLLLIMVLTLSIKRLIIFFTERLTVIFFLKRIKIIVLYLPKTYTQPETLQTCCKLRILPACCKLSTSCSKSVDFIKLQQVCENQPCCNSIFADVVVTTCSKLVDNKSRKSDRTTCSKPVERINADASTSSPISGCTCSYTYYDDSMCSHLLGYL